MRKQLLKVEIIGEEFPPELNDVHPAHLQDQAYKSIIVRTHAGSFEIFGCYACTALFIKEIEEVTE